MQEVMAMNHPDARVVGHKGDVIRGMRLNEDSIQANRATSQRLPILIQYGKDVSVQVNWMVKVALIDEMDLDELPILNHDHACIRKALPVHHEGHALAPKGSPHLVAEVDGVRCVEMALWCDRAWGRLTIRCHIKPLRHSKQS